MGRGWAGMGRPLRPWERAPFFLQTLGVPCCGCSPPQACGGGGPGVLAGAAWLLPQREVCGGGGQVLRPQAVAREHPSGAGGTPSGTG